MIETHPKTQRNTIPHEVFYTSSMLEYGLFGGDFSGRGTAGGGWWC